MKHLFLDFDGVISPYAPYKQEVVPCKSIGGFDISYLQNVVDWVNKKVEDPEWKVYWLTTWTKKIHHLSVIGISEEIENIKPLIYCNTKKGSVWKPQSGIKMYDKIQANNPHDIVVWVDDDSSINTHNGLKNLISFSPEEYTGITKEMMDEIDKI